MWFGAKNGEYTVVFKKMNPIVYINDIEIDLKPNTVVSINLQRLDIGDLSKNYLSFTNTIKAPATNKNNVAFGFANIEKSSGTTQYNILPSKVASPNGYEFFVGNAIISRFQNDEYEINIYENFISLISFLGDKDLTTLSWPLQWWTNADIDAARLSTSNFVAPLLNWGTSSVYQIDRYLPSFYYGDLLKNILQLTGYSLSGAILSSTDLTDLICTPFGRFRYKDPYQKTTKPSNDYFQFLTVSGSYDIAFPTENLPYGGMIANLKVTVGLGVDFTKNINSNSNITLSVKGSLVSTWTLANYTNDTSGTFVFNLSNINLIAAQTLLLNVFYNEDPLYPTDQVLVQVNQFLTKIEVVESSDIINRSGIQWNRLALNVRLLDIVKDFFVRFGIVFKTDGNTLVLRTLEDICTDTAKAVDWTNKRVNTNGDSINFKTNYGQNNNFLYNDKANNNLLGSGALSIANSTLKSTVDFFTSIFGNSNRWNGTGYGVMSIPVYDATSTGIGDTKNDGYFAIGTLKNRTNESDITFNSTPRNDYRLAYFVDLLQNKDTGFQYFINKYYATIGRALQTNKVCTYTYLLTEQDIANYDPHRMVFDNGSYYLINKISNFIPGRLTRVELFKIQ